MARLTYKQRKRMSKKSFVFPKRKTKSNPAGRGAYPIPDKAHARNALARVSAFGTPAEKAAVRRAVCKKYPSIQSCKEKATKKRVTRKKTTKRR